MEKVLITGVSGFIGQNVATYFLSKGLDVYGVDIRPSKLTGFKFYQMDINSPEMDNVFKVNDFDYIVHLAANSSVPYSVSYPLDDAHSNYLGSIRICELAKKYGVKRLIAASTAALYARPRYLPVKESHPPNCLSPYAITKQSMEYYIVLSGVKYTILRFSNVYGPGQNRKGEAGVISIFIDGMNANEDIKIFGDGSQIRDFIYIDDVVDALYQTMFSERCQNQIMNISSNTAITINELFHKIKHFTGYQKQPTYLPEREGDIKASILDNSLAKELFGFSPKVDITTGLKNSIECLKQPI